MTSETEATLTNVTLNDSLPSPARSRARKVLRVAGWIAFATGCLLFFTLMKLPEVRIKSYVNGMISSFLAPKGISFTAAESSISMFFGLSYELKDVTLNFPPPEAPVKIQEIEVSPSLLPLLFGKMGGKISVVNAGGKLNASFAVHNTAQKGEFSVSFKAQELDIGKLGILPIAAGIQGTGVISGSGAISGEMNSPATWNGDVRLDLKNVALNAQQISGFSIPKLSISEGTADISAGAGKATLKNLRLGKAGSQDDIIATITGDLGLGKSWPASTMNLKSRFSLSQNILKSFALIDALLTQGKQEDGSYAYDITGSFMSPIPTPQKNPSRARGTQVGLKLGSK